MPILIAIAIATLVVTTVLGVAARLGRRHDPVDVRASVDGLVQQAHRHPALQRFALARRDATKATGLLLTVALAVIAVLTLGVGLVLEMVQTRVGFARWDDAAARWGASHTTGAVETVVLVITQLGSTVIVVVLGLVVSVIEYRRLPTWAVPTFLATVVTSQLIVTNVIKLAVGRERPTVARLVAAQGFSFPSGHTAASAAAFAAIALVVGRSRSRRTKVGLGIAAAGVAVAVATSRVLLGAHWLTDVIAGVFVGWGCFALCSIAFGGRLLHFGAPVEAAEAVLVAESLPAMTTVPPTSPIVPPRFRSHT